MGISSANFDLITTVETQLGGWKNMRVLDLGNQILRDSGPLRRTSKQYFEALGAEHVSFDLNGLDGALQIDLCKPVPEEFWGRFDMVTNFGTSEHIEDQLQVFETIFQCCRVDGFMAHSLPLVGYWKGHSPYLYPEDFGGVLGIFTHCRILQQRVVPRGREKLLNILLQKAEVEKGREYCLYPAATKVVRTGNFRKDSNNRGQA